MLDHHEQTTGRLRTLHPLFLLLFCASFSLTGTGDTDSLVAELDEKIPPLVAAGNAPSMQVAVIQGDKMEWSRAFGESASEKVEILKEAGVRGAPNPAEMASTVAEVLKAA